MQHSALPLATSMCTLRPSMPLQLCSRAGGRCWSGQRDREQPSTLALSTLIPAAAVLQGWEELLELLERQRDRGEPLPEIAGFGSGEAGDSVSFPMSVRFRV